MKIYGIVIVASLLWVNSVWAQSDRFVIGLTTLGPDPQLAAKFDLDVTRVCRSLESPNNTRNTTGVDASKTCRRAEQHLLSMHIEQDDEESRLAKLKQTPPQYRDSVDIRNIRSLTKVVERAKAAVNAAESYVVGCYEAISSSKKTIIKLDADISCFYYLDTISEGEKIMVKYQKLGKRAEGMAVYARAKAQLNVARAHKQECIHRVDRTFASILEKRRLAASSLDIESLVDMSEEFLVTEEKDRLAHFRVACKQSVESRRENRLRIAESRPLDELREIPVQYLLPVEKLRLDDADLAEQQLLAKRRLDKRWAGPVLSAAICVSKGHKRDLTKEIKTEIRYAKKYTGYVDKSKLYGLQEEIKLLDGVIAESKKRLKRVKGRPLGCGQKTIQLLAHCMPFLDYSSGSDDKACLSGKVPEFLEISDVVPDF